jgi:hypothetical protein
VKGSTSRIGTVGTFYTAAELAQRGWEATLTLGNALRTDILAQHAENQLLVGVQCKTSSSDSPAWFRLSITCEEPSPPSQNEWFVFTRLQGLGQRPIFYVMPRDVVAAYLFLSHRIWLTSSKPDGMPRVGDTQRNVEFSIAAPYLERWDLMEKPAANAPAWLPKKMFPWIKHLGLPTGHPGLVEPNGGVQLPAAPKWLTSAPA